MMRIDSVLGDQQGQATTARHQSRFVPESLVRLGAKAMCATPECEWLSRAVLQPNARPQFFVNLHSPSQFALAPTDSVDDSTWFQNRSHVSSQHYFGAGGRASAAAEEARSRAIENASAYVSVVRRMLDRDEIASARAVLNIVLSQPDRPSELVRTAEILAPPTSIKRNVRDRERTNEYAWLNANAHAYRGQWVAVVGGELVCAAASLKDLLAFLRMSGRQHEALVHRFD